MVSRAPAGASFVLLTVLGSATLTVSANPPALEFSAEAVQISPSGELHNARIFVGNGGVRREIQTNGQRVVEIIRNDLHRMWTLAPAHREYVETRFGGRQMATGAGMGSPGTAGRPASGSPCEGVPDVTCKLVGTEEVSGRETEKWEMVGHYGGQTLRSLLWIDKERRIPMRQFMPNGMTSELRFLGRETLNGRPVEKWELVTTEPHGQSTKSWQWYDPELRIAVREELPGGYARELRNIVVAPQPPELFELPTGYHRVEALQQAISNNN